MPTSAVDHASPTIAEVRETRRRRRRISRTALGVLGLIALVWFRLAPGIADRRADAVERSLSRALASHSPDDFTLWVFDPAQEAARDRVIKQVHGGRLSGGVIDEFRFEVMTWWALWEPRCVLARPALNGKWETRTADRPCDHVNWPRAGSTE